MKQVAWVCPVVLASVVASWAQAAVASTFEEVAEGASPVASAEELAGLFWTDVGDCAGAPDDLSRRQCEGIRRARADQRRDQVYLVEGDATSLVFDKYDAKRRSAKMKLTPCIACAKPLDVDGRAVYLVGGKPSAADGVVSCAPVHKGARVFGSAEEEAKWRTEVLPRIRVQFLLRSGEKVASWRKGALEGLQVKIAGYRVYDPCSGEVLAAKPTSSAVPPDQTTCPESEKEAKAEAEPPLLAESLMIAAATDKPKPPPLPAQLSTYQISRAMAPVRAEADKCYRAFGVAGRAMFRITVNNDGKVIQLKQKGDFEDTPTGGCVEKAIREAPFPAMKKKAMTFSYPLVLG